MEGIEKLDLKNKKIILRVDYNVPLKNGKVRDNERILATLPTIKMVLDKGGAIIIISHLGRPEGKPCKELSLKPAAQELEKLLGKKVTFIEDIAGGKAEQAAGDLKSGQIIMLENLRFSAAEVAGDRNFAQKIASYGDIFVQDAFANAHRAHASMVAITEFIPSYSGLLFENEYKQLSTILDNPAKPFVFILGGKKVETKINLLKKIVEKADIVMVGGGISNTFLAAEGYEIGKSFFEEEYLDEASEVVRKAEERGVEFLIPEDVIVSKSISDSSSVKAKFIEEMDETDIIVDIGPITISKFSEPLKFAGTIFWNGPVGIAELKNFANGTKAIAKILVSSQAITIIGGGDTIGILKNENLEKGFNYISTGGGAAMEFLSGNKLPAVESLLKRG